MSLQEINDLARSMSRANPRDTEEQLVILEHLRRVRNDLEQSSNHDLAGCLDAASLLSEYLIQVGCLGPEAILQVMNRLVNIVQDAFTGPLPTAESEGSSAPAAPIVQTGLVGQRPQHVSHQPQLQHAQHAQHVQHAQHAQHAPAPSPYQAPGPQLIEPGFTRIPESLKTPPPPKWTSLRGSGEPGLDLRMASDRYLGEILIDMGAITKGQLDKALEIKRMTGLRTGQALIDMGAATWEEVKEAVRIQKSMQPNVRVDPHGRLR